MDNQEWIETTATVYSCGWEDTPVDGLLRHRLFSVRSGHYIVVFSYTVDGHHYSGEFTSLQEWKEGATFQIKYDFRNPEQNDRTNDEDGPLMTVLAWVGGIALVALYFWWKNRK